MLKWIAGLGLGLVSVIATAGEPQGQSNLENSPSFGLYVQKSFGGHQDQGSSFAFGFRMHSDASGLFTDVSGAQQSWRTLPLVDIRFTGAGDRSLRLYGVTTFRSADSGGVESWKNPWFLLCFLLGLAVVVDCAADLEPCGGGGNNGSSDHPPPPTTGTAGH